jgi:hypothetical protein
MNCACVVCAAVNRLTVLWKSYPMAKVWLICTDFAANKMSFYKITSLYAYSRV